MKKIIVLSIAVFALTVLFAETLTLDIIFSNDIHGGIDRYPASFINPDFPPMLGGGASIARYVKRVREYTDKKQRDNLLIDAGDFFQGHPIGTLSEGKAVIKFMNMVNYDLSVVGNHEYDLGEDVLIDAYKLAEFPILSCNIIDKETGKLVDYVTPYIIMEKLGIKIGIIGVTTTDTEKMSFPKNIEGLDFTSAKEALQKYVPIVRNKGVDLLFVVGHMGLPYEPEPAYQKRYVKNEEMEKQHYWGYDAQELAHEINGIDVFFGGHMHKGFAEPWEDPVTHTMVVQSYAYGSSIGHLILKIDKETKSIAGYEKPSVNERDGLLVTMFEDIFIPVPSVSDSILAMQSKVDAGMDKVVGIADMHISKLGSGTQSLIGNLVCEAMLEYTEADFSFLNLGGVRDEFKVGPITYRDVFNVMPFDNQIVVINVKGKFLKNIIETRVSGSHHGLRVAGIKTVINRNYEDFNRVMSLEIGGEPWQADKYYKVATTDFLLQGNAHLALLTKLPESQITRFETTLRQVIVEYIKKHSPVRAEIDDRWKDNPDAKMSDNTKEQLKK